MAWRFLGGLWGVLSSEIPRAHGLDAHGVRGTYALCSRTESGGDNGFRAVVIWLRGAFRLYSGLGLWRSPEAPEAAGVRRQQ